MANQLPCPNPVCTHVFSAEEVQSAETLQCPRCRQLFRFRAPGTAPNGKPPTAKPATPLAKPAPMAMPPLAAPVVAPRPAVPMAAPVARPVPAPQPAEARPFEPLAPFPEPTPFMPLDSGAPLVRSRGVVRNRWGTKHFIVLGIGGVVLAGMVTCAILYGRGVLFARPDADVAIRGHVYNLRNLKEKQEKCFSLAVDENRWSMDNNLKSGLQALTAWKHNDGEFWLAVAAQDFGQQKPRDGELMKAAIERLETHFGDALELSNKTFPAQLAGEDGRCLRFRGTINAVTWYGECYLLAHRGIGYWFFVAAPGSWDDASQTKAELEKAKRFALVSERKGWREQPPKMDDFRAQEVPLTMTVPSGAWEKSSAKDEEESGELYLFGRFLREKDNRKNASILVLTSDKKSDLKESLRVVRAYLEKRKQEENPKYKFLVVEDGASEAGAVEAVGDRNGALTELKLVLGDEPKRYVLLAVVHYNEKAVVVRCDCAWEHRQIWQQDFRNALATLKFSKME